MPGDKCKSRSAGHKASRETAIKNEFVVLSRQFGLEFGLSVARVVHTIRQRSLIFWTQPQLLREPPPLTSSILAP